MRTTSTQAPERLLTILEAGALLRVSTKTIRRWMAAGDLPAAKLGQQWRIRPQDLNRFVRDHLEG
jgi:excisionase family DNA binding protein